MNGKLIALAAVAISCAGAAVWSAKADGAGSLGNMLKVIGISGGATPLPAKTDAKPAPRTVRVVNPEAIAGTSTLTLPGRTAPAEEALLSSRASGIISVRHVDVGDHVRAGDVLIEINAPEIEQELRRARATADQVRARLLLAEATLKRGESLVGKGHVSAQTLDERRAAKEATEADFAAALAEFKRLEEVQSFQTVRAPFDGTVVARHVERGDKVLGGAGQPGGFLLRIARLDELRILIDVPQSSALEVKPGLSARVAFAELPEMLSASIVRVSGQIDQDSSTMRAELLMPNPEKRIPAGMNGQVMIEVRQDKRWVTVPTNALTTRGGRQMVAVVDSESRFQLRPVAVARDMGERVVITSGLDVRDRVIVSPNALLRPNEEVHIVEGALRAASARPSTGDTAKNRADR